MKLSKKGWLLFTGIALVVPVVFFAGFSWYNTVKRLPYYGPAFALQEQEPYYRVSDFAFVNQDGRELTDQFIEGKVWVIHYFFVSCPSICPRMMNGLISVQEAYRGNPEVRLISVTVDPGHDTPEVLKSYADAKHVDTAQWQLLTGSKEDLYRYARNVLSIVATKGDGGPGDFIHSEKLVLIDRSRHIRGYYDGTEQSEIRHLIRDIDRLTKQNN